MPDLNLTVTTVVPPSVGAAGGAIPPATVDLSQGNPIKCINNGRTIFRFTNTGGAPVTLTPTRQAGVAGATLTGAAITVPNDSVPVYAGPYPPAEWNVSGGADDGKIIFTTASGANTVKVAAISMP